MVVLGAGMMHGFDGALREGVFYCFLAAAVATGKV